MKRRTNRGVKLIKEAIKAAKAELAGRRKEEIKQRRAAESNDDRVELIRQPDDAPFDRGDEPGSTRPSAPCRWSGGLVETWKGAS